MNKVITLSIFGVGGNSSGSSYNKIIDMYTAVDELLNFEIIRKNIKEDWKQFLKGNSPVVNEFKYKCSISILTKDKIRFKIFEIDPKELR